MSKLSLFIERDIKGCIESGRDLPATLSLPALSRHYGVSITPVRQALFALEEQGYLARLPNRRLRVNPGKVGVGTADPEIPFPRDPSNWAEVLLDEVVTASLSPHAVFLREATLAERYGVGRSIIRHVFSRYSGSGLLEHVPRKGWLVQPLSEAKLVDYLTVRESLELLALDLARPRMREAELQEILANASHAHDFALHQYLITRSGNQYIREFFRLDMARYYTKLLHFAAPEASVVEEMTAEHRAILRALIVQDWKAAAEALAEHIRVQRAILAKLLHSPRARALPETAQATV